MVESPAHHSPVRRSSLPPDGPYVFPGFFLLHQLSLTSHLRYHLINNQAGGGARRAGFALQQSKARAAGRRAADRRTPTTTTSATTTGSLPTTQAGHQAAAATLAAIHFMHFKGHAHQCAGADGEAGTLAAWRSAALRPQATT